MHENVILPAPPHKFGINYNGEVPLELLFPNVFSKWLDLQ
jgi:hypothetical protein